MSEYQANSHKSKTQAAEQQEEKRVQKVVTRKAKTRTNEGRKLMNIFISEDASNVKSYVFMDVLVPAIKKAISDIVTDGIDMILYGETRGRKSGSRSSDKISYKSYYDKPNGNRESDNRIRSRFDYEDVVLTSRRDAEAVRDQMDEIIDRYGFVTVADMYDMADMTAPYTASKYGWTNVRNAEVVRVRDGFIVKLPKAMPID